MTRLLCTLLLALMLGAVRAPATRAERTHEDPANSEAGRAWQASYTAEAAGNYVAALQAMEQLPAPQRTGYTANYRRGWLEYQRGRYAESVNAYETAIGLLPDAVEARVAQLLPLMALSKWKEVVKAAQDTLKRDPQNYLAQQRMAYAQFASQHFPEAEQSYRKLLRLYPSDYEMRAALGWAVLRLGKHAEAAEQFRSVLEVSPKHPSALAGMQAATGAKH